MNGIVTKDVIDTQRVKCDVASVYADPSFSFDLKPFTKPISLGNEHIDIPELQKRYPHLAPIPPIVYNYSDVQLIIGQDAYYAIHTLDKFYDDPKNDPWAVKFLWVGL